MITDYLKIELVAAGAAAVFGAVGLLILAARIFFPAKHAVSTKLLGSILVLALAFAANQGVVYGLAIFIVATLVTDLDFLEKIAALFWNRDKYWDYRIAHASPAEVAAKTKDDAERELTAERTEQLPAGNPAAPAPPAVPAQPEQNAEVQAPVHSEADAPPVVETKREAVQFDAAQLIETDAERMLRTRRFEKAVIEAIADGKAPLPPGRLAGALRLETPRGRKIIDAVIESWKADFVIEVRYLKRPSALVDAAHVLLQYAQEYHAYLNERGRRKLVVPVLVIPSSVNAPSQLRGVVIAKFDEERNVFVDSFRVKVEVDRAINDGG